MLFNKISNNLFKIQYIYENIQLKNFITIKLF